MKKVFKPMLVLAFITLVSYNVYSSQQEVTVSDLALSNAEALATGEESSNYGPADQVKCAGGYTKKFVYVNQAILHVLKQSVIKVSILCFYATKALYTFL